MLMAGPVFAYYCSGHGYGHATRVSAFAKHLLALEPQPTVHIISSAPERVFADSIAQGALYRYAEIDPVIVQPLAYRVDRQKSVEVLKSFLKKKDAKLEHERQWLIEVKADCVLSDAAFLGCLAAHAARIPSILITNFTFDSVYSYLSTTLLDTPASPPHGHLQPPQDRARLSDLVPDLPVPHSELAPLVAQIYAGYRCADLLLLLPGSIPIPSFSVYPALPSSDWIDPVSNTLYPDITAHLLEHPSSYTLHSGIPIDLHCNANSRTVIPAPLLVRSPARSPSPFSPDGRARLLASLGIPVSRHDPTHTKILIVSFGGQVFRRPTSRSGSGSRSSSTGITPPPSPDRPAKENIDPNRGRVVSEPWLRQIKEGESILTPSASESNIPSTRLATPSHLWIPGAPPASKPPPSHAHAGGTMIAHSDVFGNVFRTATIPPTPELNGKQTISYFGMSQTDEPEQLSDDEEEPKLLPDDSWIAVVCGVSKEQWSEVSEDGQDSGLPEGFYVAPRDVYMPDLTAAADVLLGKLGYGTVSECVDSCTPFVYVSRPLFVEEHGLRLLLERDGVGVELSRGSYEAGEWAGAVEEAWMRGREAKTRKRREGEMGEGTAKRDEEGREMARKVFDWVGKRVTS